MFLFELDRAFGDKSAPPSIPHVDIEGLQELEGEFGGEERDEESKKEEDEPCPNSKCDQAADAACPNVQELSLWDREQEEGEQGVEETEEDPEEQRTPQGN